MNERIRMTVRVTFGAARLRTIARLAAALVAGAAALLTPSLAGIGAGIACAQSIPEPHPVCGYCSADVERGESHRSGCPYYESGGGGGGDGGGDGGDGGDDGGSAFAEAWWASAEQARAERAEAFRANLAEVRAELSAWRSEAGSAGAAMPDAGGARDALRARVAALAPPPLVHDDPSVVDLRDLVGIGRRADRSGPAPASGPRAADPLPVLAPRIALAGASAWQPGALVPLAAGKGGLRMAEVPPLETWPELPPAEDRPGLARELAGRAAEEGRALAGKALPTFIWTLRESGEAAVEVLETRLLDRVPRTVRQVIEADRAVLEGTQDLFSRTDAIVAALAGDSPEACLRVYGEVEAGRRETVEKVDEALGTSWRRLESPAGSVRKDLEEATGLSRVATLRRAFGGDREAWSSVVREAAGSAVEGGLDRAAGGGGE